MPIKPDSPAGQQAGQRLYDLGWVPCQAHSASSRSSVLAMLSIQTLPLSIPARFSCGTPFPGQPPPGAPDRCLMTRMPGDK